MLHCAEPERLTSNDVRMKIRTLNDLLLWKDMRGIYLLDFFSQRRKNKLKTLLPEIFA